MKRTCSQCGKEFTLSDSEIKFYKEKGLSLPKRCEACRAANKAASSRQQNASSVTPAASPQTIPTHKASAAPEQKSTARKGGIQPLRIVIGLILVVAAVFFGNGLLGGGDSDPQDNIPSSPSDVIQNPDDSNDNSVAETKLLFRNSDLLEQHYQKHGIEMGFSSAEDYEAAASAVVYHKSVLHKTEKEDGDDVYYIEDTNEFVVVSSDGYLRTYFNPSAGKDYFDRQ